MLGVNWGGGVETESVNLVSTEFGWKEGRSRALAVVSLATGIWEGFPTRLGWHEVFSRQNGTGVDDVWKQRPPWVGGTSDTVFHVTVGLFLGTAVISMSIHYSCTAEEMEPTALLPLFWNSWSLQYLGNLKMFAFTNMFGVHI